MRAALIGASGFVGGNLPHACFQDLFRSTNIEDICGRSYDLVVCAGAPAAKWKANQDPEGDLKNLGHLMHCLDQARAQRFVLISTVDVYPKPVGVDENTPIDPGNPEAYGRNRFLLEQFVAGRFPQVSIIRLPGLFGRGLKKNIIFDLLHGNALHLTHAHSKFQFYGLHHLWTDLQAVLRENLPLVNFATEPVAVHDVARRCFGVEFDNAPANGPANYDMRTTLGNRLGHASPYLYSQEEVLDEISEFVSQERAEEVA